MEKWKKGSIQDERLPWIVLSWLLLALLSFNGVFRVDEFGLDGFIFANNLCRKDLV